MSDLEDFYGSDLEASDSDATDYDSSSEEYISDLEEEESEVSSIDLDEIEFGKLPNLDESSESEPEPEPEPEDEPVKKVETAKSKPVKEPKINIKKAADSVSGLRPVGDSEIHSIKDLDALLYRLPSETQQFFELKSKVARKIATLKTNDEQTYKNEKCVEIASMIAQKMQYGVQYEPDAEKLIDTVINRLKNA
jgi:hypothetical protein